MEKDRSIESLRGIAIILVIGLHIVNDTPLRDVSEIYGYISYMFQNVRMPLFTVISGYLYAYRPVIPGNYLNFVKGKTQRIVFPLFFVMTLEFLAATYAPGVNNRESIYDISNAYLFGYQHYWFLQAIFSIILIIGAIDNFKSINTLKTWLIVFLVSIIIFIYHSIFYIDIRYFSFNHTVYLMPYFVLGMGLYNFGHFLTNRRASITLALSGTLLLIIQHFAWITNSSHLFDKVSMLGLAVSVVCCSLIFRYRRSIWGLSTIGSFAFSIYLYQGFGVPIMRRVYENLIDLGPHGYFFSVIAGTLIIGIIVELCLKRIPLISLLFLGIKSKGSKDVTSKKNN